ncbi:hypothetical protein LWI28_016239 [Acer negundo]|uniref:DNA endonuclease activator Ctp1 C-terminal domain-containing protein n=1 Tax=Acer negundo TaxID=4023 RepID=A0AAD5ILZ5_ACENE|nr:hypothetical protein LWI28_016239 [Acer negundo]
MEGNLQNSQKLGCPVDDFDTKYISGLSTILVATVEEAKDKISQIEYIFSSQIYPNFQSKSKSLQKTYSEAKKVAEDVWNEKENVLLLKIEQLQVEKQQALEENQSLMLEKAKPAKVQDGKTSQLLAILESQQLKINELELELMKKSKEVGEGMELQNKLLHLVQSKASVLADKGKQRKEHEEKTTKLVAELNCWKKKVDELQQELREKNEEIARKNELSENLVQKTEMLISDISNSRQLLTDQIQDKKLLTAKFEGFEENVGRLQEELRKKTEEVLEGRKLHELLLQKVDLNSFEMLKSKPRLEECEKEKKLLLGKVEVLEENIIKLQMDLRERSDEAAGGWDINMTLLQQIELKASEIMAEKKKRRDLIDAYKRLKTQYNLLRMKLSPTTENMLPQNKLEDESNLLRLQQKPITSPDLEVKNPSNSTVGCDTITVKQEISFCEDLDDEKGVKSDQNTCFHSPTSKFFVAPKCPSCGKSAPAAGSKRPASSWRDTRSRQSLGGADPHDDFLDTPLENIRGNLNKTPKKEVYDLPVAAPKDMNVDSLDDETRDMNVDPVPQKQQMPGPVAGKELIACSFWALQIFLQFRDLQISVVQLDMEASLQNSPKLGCPVDNFDAKYISGLSTILVATIQEAKDRISQIEYIYCSQIYPNFRSKSKSLQKIYSEAKKAAEDVWKEKENVLLLKIEQLQLEKQQVLEENRSLMLEKEKPAKVQDGKTSQLLAILESQQLKINELELELMQKSKEVDEGMELQNKLLHLVQSKATVLADKDKQRKEHEEKTTKLVAELNCWKKKVDELQQELTEKNEEIVRKNELLENLVQKTEMLISDISNSRQLLTDQIHDKKLLTAKLEGFEENVGRLQEELRKKTDEVVEGRQLHEQLLQKVDLNSFEMLKSKPQLEECEKEKKLLLGKVEVLEENIIKLQMDLRERSDEAAGGRDMNKTLLQQIELKASELMSEKKKRRDVLDAYKRLKSQYNFLCMKFGLTTENMLPQNNLEDESNLLSHQQKPITSPDLEDKNPSNSTVDCDTKKLKQEISFSEDLDDEKGVKSDQNTCYHSPTSKFFVAPKCPSIGKSAPAAGSKRPASSWRDTRSRQSPGGADPHDDFLDTPLENIRVNLNKVTRKEVLLVTAPKDVNVDSSDDETQDMNVDPGPQKQQMPGPMAVKRGFKYVEPVRKKAERQNLKGIECKQCKKFYDAVLPDNGGQDSDGKKQNFRCEHHEGVSRHRYKYIPPLTPEGFWNIGFESEM